MPSETKLYDIFEVATVQRRYAVHAANEKDAKAQLFSGTVQPCDEEELECEIILIGLAEVQP